MTKTPTDLIGTKEACLILDVDKATISRWVHAGKLAPVLRIGGKGNAAFVFKRTDVERIKRAA